MKKEKDEAQTKLTEARTRRERRACDALRSVPIHRPKPTLSSRARVPL